MRYSIRGENITDVRKRRPGARIKHRVKDNWIKMYDKFGVVLRVEPAINDPHMFRIRGLVNHEDEIANLGNRINVSVETFNREKPCCFELSVTISTAVAGPGDGISLEELPDKLHA